MQKPMDFFANQDIFARPLLHTPTYLLLQKVGKHISLPTTTPLLFSLLLPQSITNGDVSFCKVGIAAQKGGPTNERTPS